MKNCLNGNHPWFLKHKPDRFTKLVFSSDIHFKTLKWLKNAKNGGVLHISGIPGSGKTLLANLVAKALKYTAIEIDYEISSNIFDFMKNPNKSLDGKPVMLIVDEFVISKNIQILKNLKKSKIPVIITSSELFLKDVQTFKIQNYTIENILQIVNGILKEERLLKNISINQNTIIKVASKCNRDIRMIINMIQLISRCDGNIEISKMVSDGNIFAQCQKIFSKRIRMSELIEIYSPRLAEYCLNYAFSAVKDVKQMTKIITGFSDVDEYNNYLALAPMNEFSGDFVYTKEDLPDIQNPLKKEYPLHFLNKYSRNTFSENSVDHFQKIFKRYKIKDLTFEDEVIKTIKKFKEENKKVLKYQYFEGSSAAVKRDVSLKEFLEF